MGGSSKRVTTGYRYYMGLHFGLCHGPVDAVHDVIVGERLAWTGAQTTSGELPISASELFGGDKREGGVEGVLDIMMGEPAQAANGYLVSKLGSVIPAFRGILSAVWRGGQVSANNPYVKPWAFRVRRILQGWTGGTAWYPEKAVIGSYLPPSTLLDWAAQTNGFGALSVHGVAFAAGFYVAVGANGKAQRSADGVTWVDSPISVSSSYTLYAIAGSDEILVSVGDAGTIRVSSNGGESWSVVSDPAISYTILSLASHESLFIAGYQGGLILRSFGGSAWESVNTGAGAVSFYAVAHGINMWVIGGTGGAMCYSTDSGDSWTVVTDKPSTDTISAISYANEMWVAVSNIGQIITSSNGSNWVSRSSGLAGFSGEAGIAYGHGMFVVSLNDEMVTSADGITWSEWAISDPGKYLVSLDSMPNGLIGVGASGRISTSTATLFAPAYPDMNPAHIIYQCLTDTSWGMGYPTGAVDSASFTAAADALHAEGFGLSLLWNQQEDIESFVGIVLDHIGGMLYVRPDAETFALKLIRADYSRPSLSVYGPANLISAEDYQRQAWGETVNEITVVYTDSTTGKDTPITIQDTSNILMQGGVVAQTRNYPGIRYAHLAQRVAMRDLNAASTPLARIKLTATRAAWSVFPGDVFRLNWPEYGVDDVVYRALNVNRGTLTDGQIIIDAVEDVFGLPENTYLVEQPGEWEDPSNEPAPAPYRLLQEAPYWDLVRNLSQADMSYVDSLSGYLETLAVRPSNDATNYSVYARTGSADYTQRGNGDFCPTATIIGALTKTTTAITLENGIDLDIVDVGGYAIVGSEYVLVESIDWLAGTATIARAVLDTVPTEHAAGARIWFADGYQGFDTTEFADGESVDVKLRPITGRGELALAAAPVDALVFDQRQDRPYPPAKIRFDTLEWPPIIEGSADVVLTWAHRDRTLQTAYIVTQDEASIGPEASVTYSVEVADEALAVLHSATGISGTTATVPASSLTSGLLRFRLWSVRGGLESWQVHEHWAIWGDIRVTESGEPRITESEELRSTE